MPAWSLTESPVGSLVFPPNPPLVVAGRGLAFWVSGDFGLVSVAGKAVSLQNHVFPINPNLGSLNNPPTDSGPTTGADSLDGVPGLSWPLPNGDGRQMYLGGIAQAAMKDTLGAFFGYGVGNRQPRTLISVIRPEFAAATFDITGGAVSTFSSNPNFEALFDLEDTVAANSFYLFSQAWRDPGPPGPALRGPATAGGVGGIYNGTPLVVEWSSNGFPDITVKINGVPVALSGAMPGVAGVGLNAYIFGSSGSGAVAQWRGSKFEELVYDVNMPDFPTEYRNLYLYLKGRYPSIALTVP